jgi:hypothetical protein
MVTADKIQSSDLLKFCTHVIGFFGNLATERSIYYRIQIPAQSVQQQGHPSRAALGMA